MEQTIIALFLTFFILESLVELFLNEMNMDYVRRRWAERGLPAFAQDKIGVEDYRKSVEYTLAKGGFQRWADLYGGLITLIVLFGGILPYLEHLSQGWGSLLPPSTQATGIFFCFSIGLIFSLLNVPSDLYFTFVIEERFGFNKSTFRLYLTDKFKGLLLAIVIGIPFLFGVLWLMEVTGAYWWAWALVFILAFQLLMVVLYPTLIAPLFNKFEPLQEGQLRERILALADQVGFKTGGIYTMDGSKRSAHSNAYFTGIGKTKRIVLFDTLVERLSIGQGIAVLAHEMGHYKMKHILRMMLLQGFSLFAGLYVLSLLVDYGPFFRAFGLERPSHHGALVLFALLSHPFTFYLSPLVNYISRRHEYEADRYAVRALKDGKPMEEALIHLAVNNLSNLTPHPWYSAYHYSHPTVAERIHAIRQESVSVDSS
jgi:STE24 endopeptidase